MDVAGGGLANITYDDLARQGRFGDKFVTHVGEGEMVLPVEFLDQNPYIKNKIHSEITEMGLNPSDFTMSSGDLSNMNPQTGLPEFGFFSKIWKAVKKVVKKVAPIVLPIVAGAVCGPACAAAASGAITKAQGGSWGDALKSAAFSYVGGRVAQGAGYAPQAGSFSDFVANPAAQFSKGIAYLNPWDSATSSLKMPTYFKAGAAPGQYGTSDIFTRAGSQFAQSTGIGQAQGQGIWSPAPTSTSPVGSAQWAKDMQKIKDTTSGSVSTAPKGSAQWAKDMQAAADARGTPGTPEWARAGGSVTPPGGTVGGGGTGGGAGGSAAPAAPAAPAEGILGTGVTWGQALTAGASLAPLVGTALAEEQPIPVDKIGEIDQQQRDDILAYNACLGSGDGNLTPNCADEFAQATDLHSGSWGVNFMSSLGDYYTAPVQQVPVQQARGGAINGPGTGTSDDIPAYLSDGEFVMTAEAVRNAGGGNRKKGVKNMYKMMRALESNSCPSCAAA